MQLQLLEREGAAKAGRGRTDEVAGLGGVVMVAAGDHTWASARTMQEQFTDAMKDKKKQLARILFDLNVKVGSQPATPSPPPHTLDEPRQAWPGAWPSWAWTRNPRSLGQGLWITHCAAGLLACRVMTDVPAGQLRARRHARRQPHLLHGGRPSHRHRRRTHHLAAARCGQPGTLPRTPHHRRGCS